METYYDGERDGFRTGDEPLTHAAIKIEARRGTVRNAWDCRISQAIEPLLATRPNPRSYTNFQVNLIASLVFRLAWNPPPTANPLITIFQKEIAFTNTYVTSPKNRRQPVCCVVLSMKYPSTDADVRCDG
ncbi:hypothetical protein WAI453_007483 [Rhynchosporium graminicola]